MMVKTKISKLLEDNNEPLSLLIAQLIRKQLASILIHSANLVSNFLGNDFLSCNVRKFMFHCLGARFGTGTVIRGGSYIYGSTLSTGIECQINRNCYFDFTDSITFGNNVVVGHGVTFITTEHEIGNADRRAGKPTKLPITIEDGVWIGANSTILPGVVVSRGAVIAAGAIVTKNVPPNVLVAGVPAKVIKHLEETIIATENIQN